MDSKKIQWHPGFVAASELEFWEDKDNLEFKREYNLSTKPLQIDLLITKKNLSAMVSNEIGKIFRKYNIIEYKSPDDSVNIDTFYKAQIYAGLYKVSGKAVDERKAEDITVSIIRERKPAELFKILKSKNVKIIMPYKGIYYIDGIVWFPTQVIVTRELPAKGHTWIKSLSGKMTMPDMERLLNEMVRLKSKYERELADSILDVALKANKALAETLKGEVNMSEALLELVEPLIQDRMQKEKQEGQIIGAVNALRSFGHADEEIKTGIMKSYNLSEEEAEKYL